MHSSAASQQMHRISANTDVEYYVFQCLIHLSQGTERETNHMMTSSNGNISRVTGPLWGESTGHLSVNSPHKGQWRGALMFSLIYAWTNGWAKYRDAGDLRRHCTHYDVTVIRCNGMKGPRIQHIPKRIFKINGFISRVQTNWFKKH